MSVALTLITMVATAVPATLAETASCAISCFGGSVGPPQATRKARAAVVSRRADERRDAQPDTWTPYGRVVENLQKAGRPRCACSPYPTAVVVHARLGERLEQEWETSIFVLRTARGNPKRPAP